MELIKTSVNYMLSDSTETLLLNGRVSVEFSGPVNIWVKLETLEHEYVGTFNYNKSDNSVNVSYDISNEEKRVECANYVDTLIAKILDEIE
jgi:hypothetical protein